ncbi:DUF192 domain-containing protein [Halomonas profundus]|jgi:uncharacterized membrane protein (UPF0127 family)|uniref:DUF192 domain-containing protein n=1 Tax=Vreelandella titanicae TaxID=664683 RepID=UPI0013737929|nr:DUF192 domain-containing protein [Halomonas titanicae]NAO95705.1 DUF192 domain-containing protein [Halomonas sp. MG34]QNU64736.1 DUF192 domain-containing protein [Halomonas titanicae]UEQ03018.1 DUF192 domain-containing protein [Halomonas profundus]
MDPTRRTLLKASLLLPMAALLPMSLLSSFAWGQASAQKMQTLALAIHSEGGPHRLEVEVAETASQRQRGLMGRESLPEKSGMLFRFENEQSANNAFWMYRTLIPLDIAFIDSDGRIVAINTMQPCESSSPSDCPSYPAGAAYHSALEVNGGYFAERGIKVGDCVSIPEEAGFCQPGD